VTATDWTTDANGTGQYAEVNGINLYFETRGDGRPLILLYGGLGSGWSQAKNPAGQVRGETWQPHPARVALSSRME
jgi:hypothetical protein